MITIFALDWLIYCYGNRIIMIIIFALEWLIYHYGNRISRVIFTYFVKNTRLLEDSAKLVCMSECAL